MFHFCGDPQGATAPQLAPLALPGAHGGLQHARHVRQRLHHNQGTPSSCSITIRF